jgi:tRNA threonylcarbamoyladenosine biosynthesis protein TsaE
LDELLDRDAVILVEWGERFPPLWPPGHIEIRLEAVGEARRIHAIIPR